MRVQNKPPPPLEYGEVSITKSTNCDTQTKPVVINEQKSKTKSLIKCPRHGDGSGKMAWSYRLTHTEMVVAVVVVSIMS